uniref:Secreted protein n=1 Tax=Steinernema glaseri TaxID=37863 RepID=A0A1I8AFD9_9BILA
MVFWGYFYIGMFLPITVQVSDGNRAGPAQLPITGSVTFKTVIPFKTETTVFYDENRGSVRSHIDVRVPGEIFGCIATSTIKAVGGSTTVQTPSMSNYDESIAQRVYSRTNVFVKKRSSDADDAFDFCATHKVPFAEIKAKVKEANEKQLEEFEKANPWFLKNTAKLWKKHCSSRFAKLERGADETWRDVFQRGLQEEQLRLHRVSARITNAVKKEQQSVRTIKCIALPTQHKEKNSRAVASSAKSSRTVAPSSTSSTKPSTRGSSEAVPSRAGAPGKGYLMKKVMDVMKKRR